MRLLALMSILVAILLAGCASPDAQVDEPPAADQPSTPAPPATQLPENFTKDITVLGGFEAIGEAAQRSCSLQPWCFGYGFVADRAVAVDAVLEWGLPATDFDLYLLHDGTEIARSATHTPGVKETLATTLGPGSYEIVVVPYAVIRDDAVLDVTFAAGEVS